MAMEITHPLTWLEDLDAEEREIQDLIAGAPKRLERLNTERAVAKALAAMMTAARGARKNGTGEIDAFEASELLEAAQEFEDFVNMQGRGAIRIRVEPDPKATSGI